MAKINLLKNHTFSFFDVETTGLDPRYGDRICEVAVLKWRNGKAIETYQTLVNPMRSISEGAFAVNGITQRMLRGKPQFEDIAPSLTSILKNSILVCHNAPFDVGFLITECNRVGVEIPEFTVIDTLALARCCFNFWSNSLGNIAEALKIEVQEEHRAMADVKTTLEVFLRFVANFEWRGINSLEQILFLHSEPSRHRFNKEFALPPQLDEAVKNKKPLCIKYVSAFGEKTERIVEPKEIISERDYLYLVAHCRLRMAERNFRLDRIVEMKIHEGGNL